MLRHLVFFQYLTCTLNLAAARMSHGLKMYLSRFVRILVSIYNYQVISQCFYKCNTKIVLVPLTT